MSVRSQGVVLSLGTGTGSPETFTAVGEVLSFNGPNRSRTVLDTTNLGSVAKEKLPGLLDSGEMSFQLNTDYGDAGQALARTRLAAGTGLSNFKLAVPAGAGTSTGTATTYTFAGFVSKDAEQGGVDQLLKGNLTITISGTVGIA